MFAYMRFVQQKFKNLFTFIQFAEDKNKLTEKSPQKKIRDLRNFKQKELCSVSACVCISLDRRGPSKQVFDLLTLQLC